MSDFNSDFNLAPAPAAANVTIEEQNDHLTADEGRD